MHNDKVVLIVEIEAKPYAPEMVREVEFLLKLHLYDEVESVRVYHLNDRLREVYEEGMSDGLNMAASAEDKEL